MNTTIVILLTAVDRFLVTTAQTTNAREIPGIEKIKNISPMFAVEMDLSRRRDVPVMTTIINIIAPHRSILAAWLKKSHHTAIASPQAIPPKYPIAAALGAMAGRRYLKIH